MTKPAPRVSVLTRRHGRVLLYAGTAYQPASMRPAPFAATGLADESVWAMLAGDMPAVTWELARRHRMRHIRALYRRRRR